MRILFTFVGGSGHYEPLVPIARAAQAAGHTVAFGCGASMVAAVAAAGFSAFQMGQVRAGPPERLPLQPLDIAHEEQVLRERFAREGVPYRAPLTIELCRAWQPDLLVCDETDFGAMVAAELLALPYAVVLVLLAGGFARPDLLAEPLDEQRAAQGLPPDPDLTMLSRYLVFAPLPPSYRDPAFPLPATAHAIRPVFSAPLAQPPLPAWLSQPDDRPTVYATLGTIYNLESGDLFARVLAGLRALPINVIMTVGRHIDPAEFGSQPGNVHIAQYIPQAAILPRCRAVVSHGGSGSVIGALAHGLPSVLLPMGADQPHNAARGAALGAALVLDAVAATPETIAAAVLAVLDQPGYRRAAEQLREQIAALPEPSYAVRLLERLAVERRPIVA